MFLALGFLLVQLVAALLTKEHSWQETRRGFGHPRQGMPEVPRCRIESNLTGTQVESSRVVINSGVQMGAQKGFQQGNYRRTDSPARIEQLQPIFRADAKRVRLYFGPYNIPGQKVCSNE
jgi:hypothetical protein